MELSLAKQPNDCRTRSRPLCTSALIFNNGQSILQMVQEDENLAKLASFLVSDGPVCTFQPDKIREIFYAHCTNSDAEWAASMLVPQPFDPSQPRFM